MAKNIAAQCQNGAVKPKKEDKDMRPGRPAKKSIIIVVTALVVAALCSVSALAFFTSDFFNRISGSVTQNGTGDAAVVDVASFAELWEYSVGAAQPAVFNDPDAVTDVGERVILRFTRDITLENDIIFTSDCHIDLGGHTLYLNGRSLTVSHTYSGTAMLKNGRVIVDAAADTMSAAGTSAGTSADTSADTSSADTTSASTSVSTRAGRIYFNTPNAVAFTESLTYARSDGTALAESDVVTDISAEQNVIAYGALSLVAEKLANGTDVARVYPTYDELTALTSFPASLFHTTKPCATKGGEDSRETCVFVFGDLDLPTHILAYDGVTVAYSSSDTAVLDNFGKVTVSSAGIQTVSLTATVSRDGAAIGECTFRVHVVDPKSDAQLVEAGQTLAAGYLSHWYDADADVYTFKRSLQLPARLYVTSDRYIGFDYRLFTDDTTAVDNVLTAVNDYTCLLEPATTVKFLDVTASAGTQSVTTRYDVTASDAGLIRTQVSYAQDFAVNNYGGQITLRVTEDENGVLTFDSKALKTPETGGANSKIASIAYSLINDTNDLYALDGCDAALDRTSEDGLLYVKYAQTGRNPLDYVQTVQLNCHFTFTDGATADIQIPVKCVRGGGDNIAEFLVYYNYYDQMFFTVTGCYTVKSFDMPFATGDTNGDFAVCYDLLTPGLDGAADSWNTVQGISVGLYYNGVNHTLTPAIGLSGDGYNTYKSYVPALNAHLDKFASDNGITSDEALKKIISYGDAKWVFTIITSGNDALPTENQDFEFVYNYRLLQPSQFFRRFDSSETQRPMVTAFTLPGILTYGTGTAATVSDLNLYTWMYNVFSGSGRTYAAGDVVLTDWLRQNFPVDVNDAENGALLAAVRDFNGLQYIKGATYVNLSGVDLSGDYDNTMMYISEMSAVEELWLCNCRLSASSGMGSTTDDSLGRITALKNLMILHLENTYGSTQNLNTIYSFEFLESLPSLNKVYVYGNLDPDTIPGTFYGSEGLVNMSAFNELTGAGVMVYNTASESAQFLFADSAGINDFRILQGIEYQSKLRAGVSIERVYESFVGATATDFGLNTSYTIGGSTYNVSNQSLDWDCEGDDKTTSTRFYVTYSFSLGGTSVSMRVSFDVVRVGAA